MRIALHGNLSQSYGASPAIQDHTGYRWMRSTLTSARQAGWYSIYQPRTNGRLSWPWWLVTYWERLSAHRPIQVASWPSVGQLRWLDTTH